jgi:hypothetical protein
VAKDCYWASLEFEERHNTSMPVVEGGREGERRERRGKERESQKHVTRASSNTKKYMILSNLAHKNN